MIDHEYGQKNSLTPMLEAQCMIAGCLLHRSGYQMFGVVMFDLARDLIAEPEDRQYLRRSAQIPERWKVDLFQARSGIEWGHLLQPIAQALYDGMRAGADGVAEHFRGLAERGELSQEDSLELYLNCAPLLAGEDGIRAREREAMRELLDSLFEEADAILDACIEIANDSTWASRGWETSRLPGGRLAEVPGIDGFCAEFMHGLLEVLGAMEKQECKRPGAQQCAAEDPAQPRFQNIHSTQPDDAAVLSSQELGVPHDATGRVTKAAQGSELGASSRRLWIVLLLGACAVLFLAKWSGWI